MGFINRGPQLNSSYMKKKRNKKAKDMLDTLDDWKFDLQIAVDDHGVCSKQCISCSECEMLRYLGYEYNDQMCEWEKVLSNALTLLKIKKLKNLLKD